MASLRSFLLLFLVALLSSCSLGLQPIPVPTLEQRYTNAQSKFIDINGLRVHYRDEGQGEPVLLLHGVLSSLHTWDGWVEELKADYRLIRLDMPGFGLTGPPNFEYSVDNSMHFFKTFVDELGLERFNVAGNSLGGYMAWNFAVRWPERIDRMILLDPVGYPAELPFALEMFNAPVLGAFATSVTPRWFVEDSVRDVYGDQSKVTDELVNRYYDLMLRPNNREAAKMVLAMMEQHKRDFPHLIREIKTTTLLMWGDKDDWVPVSQIELWKRDLPSLQLILYQGVGHVPMEEIPVKSAGDARQFLAKKQ